jgi:hypothetical protein
MYFRLIAACLGLMVITVACDLAKPEPTLTPSRTPRPTITATYTQLVTNTREATVTRIPPTETATPPDITPKASTTETVTVTPTLTATATRRPAIIVRPTIAPLEITNVLLIRIERDRVRENGAIVYLQVVYAGGKGPYRIFHDDTLQPENPFQVLTVCDGTIVHTIIVNSADGQTVTQGYYFEHIYCPPDNP